MSEVVRASKPFHPGMIDIEGRIRLQQPLFFFSL
jgi:hypothetical protein